MGMDVKRVMAAWGSVAAGLLLAGCLSREALYEELAEARTEAYESWRRVREEGELPVPAERLSRDDAVRIALLYNKSLQSKLQERVAARGQVVAAHRPALPHATLNATSGRGTTERDEAVVTVRQTLFRGGAVSAGLRAAKLYAFRSDEGVRDTAQQVIQQVTSAYYAALLADSLCHVNRDAVASAEAHLADVRVKRANGVASKYDELRAQVDVANFRAELIRQENSLVLAKITLLRTMGTATDATIQLSDPLERVPVFETLESAIASAYRNRPDLMMAELNIRLQREQVTAVRSRYLPQVDLALSAGAERTYGDGRGWQDLARAGLEFSWPLFDGFGREGELIVERARLRQREIELADVEQDVFLDVQQALLSLKNADEFVESQRLNLQHAEEGLRLTMSGYREGVNTEVEIVDARASLTLARGNYYRALFDHCMARLGLDHATGRLGRATPLPAESPEREREGGVEGDWLRAVERLLVAPRQAEGVEK